MKNTFIIKFTSEEKSETRYEKETRILGKFNDSDEAVNYLRKYYNHDVTNGDKNIKVIEESITTTQSKNGELNCYVKKVYQYEYTRYTDIMEIVIPVELSSGSNPLEDIYSFFG